MRVVIICRFDGIMILQRIWGYIGNDMSAWVFHMVGVSVLVLVGICIDKYGI
jgi:hypothetical protein